MVEQSQEVIKALQQITRMHLEICKTGNLLWQISLALPEQEKESQPSSVSATVDASKQPLESNVTNLPSHSINSQATEAEGESTVASDSPAQDSPVQPSTIDDTASQSKATKLPDIIPETSSTPKPIIVQPPPASHNKKTKKGSKSRFFDVFFCHNSKDKPFITGIKSELEGKWGLKCWLDEDDIPAGLWDEILTKQAETVKSVAIFIGKNGIGNYQNEEIQVFRAAEKKRKTNGSQLKLIPVVLPNADDSNIPLILQPLIRVDFNKHPNPVDKLARLIQGVSSSKLSLLLGEQP